MTKTLFALAVAVGSLSILGGCAMAPDQGGPAVVEKVSDGLSVMEADEAAGKLVVKFRKDGREIVFDMRLGEPMESPNPDAEKMGLPTRMNDARVLDAMGLPFHMQMGADRFIDPTWKSPRVEGFDEAGRLADFGLLRDSESAWATLALPAWAEDLRLGAMDIARNVEAVTVKEGVPNTVPIGGDGALNQKLLGSIEWAGSSVVKWDYKIYEKDAILSGSPYDHSAVLLRGWTSSYSIAYTAVSCNHGACANSTAMTRSCTMSGYRTDDGTHSRYFYEEDQTGTSINGGCSTGYAAIWDNYKHVCNDDSLIQRDAIYWDASQSRTTGTCADTTKNYWGPGCH